MLFFIMTKYEVPEEIRRRIGKNIKYLRLKNNMKQKDLSEQMNCHQNYLCGVEKGRWIFSVGGLVKIAGILDVNVGSLLDEDFFK